MKVINTREATVKTAAITIKALTVAGKQVTLSVFRQLQQAPIIDPETLQLRGVPWGKVNYRWGTCAERGERHLHVVWQQGEGLKRDCIEPRGEDQPAVGQRLALIRTRHTNLALALELAVGLATDPGVPSLSPWDYYHNVHVRWKGGDFGAAHDWISSYWIKLHQSRTSRAHLEKLRADNSNEVAIEYAIRKTVKADDEANDQAAKILAEINRHSGAPPRSGIPDVTRPDFLDNLAVRVNQLAESSDDYARRYANRYAELAALDQLFIAV